MKYVMFEVPLGEGLVRRVGVVFSEAFVHLHMAQAVLKMPEMKTAKAVSAGMVDQFWYTFGGSTSMNMGSRPGDGQIIRFPQLMLTGAPTEPEPYKTPYKSKDQYIGMISDQLSVLESILPKPQPKPKSGDWGTTKPEF